MPYNEKDTVDLEDVLGALQTSLSANGAWNDVSNIETPTNNAPFLGKTTYNQFEFTYKGNIITISKAEDFDSSRYYYKINHMNETLLAKNKFGWHANSGDFQAGLKDLLQKMKKM